MSIRPEDPQPVHQPPTTRWTLHRRTFVVSVGSVTFLLGLLHALSYDRQLAKARELQGQVDAVSSVAQENGRTTDDYQRTSSEMRSRAAQLTSLVEALCAFLGRSAEAPVERN